MFESGSWLNIRGGVYRVSFPHAANFITPIYHDKNGVRDLGNVRVIGLIVPL